MPKRGTQVVEKKRKERFENLPTHLTKVKLKVEPGTILLSRKEEITEKLYQRAQELFQLQREINARNTHQNTLKAEITDIVKEIQGLRGLTSKRNKENFSLTVFPSKKVSWDRDKLKEALKYDYFLAVNETRKFIVTVPDFSSSFGTLNKNTKVIEKAIDKALSKLKIGTVGKRNLIKREISIEVNEERLENLVAHNKINLPEKTKKVEVTWKVRVDPI